MPSQRWVPFEEPQSLGYAADVTAGDESSHRVGQDYRVHDP
jgi:hypothetical protein